MDVFVRYQEKFIIMCSNIFKISNYLPQMGPGIELTVLFQTMDATMEARI